MLWNSLPADLVGVSSLGSFKGGLDVFLAERLFEVS